MTFSLQINLKGNQLQKRGWGSLGLKGGMGGKDGKDGLNVFNFLRANRGTKKTNLPSILRAKGKKGSGKSVTWDSEATVYAIPGRTPSERNRPRKSSQGSPRAPRRLTNDGNVNKPDFDPHSVAEI